MIVQKRPMTLLELVIALSLTMIILSTLTYFYHQLTTINAAMDKAQKESFQLRFVENRLASVLPRIVSAKDPQSEFHFFTAPNLTGLFKEGSSSLVFVFDNCVQLNKEMAYHVIARLYLDQEGNLTLAKWPVQKRWKENETPPLHKEVLMQNVDSLAFDFFIPPLKGAKAANGQAQPNGVEGIPADLRGRWVEEWPMQYRQLPAIVRLKLKTANFKGEEMAVSYAFPLPHAPEPITYGE